MRRLRRNRTACPRFVRGPRGRSDSPERLSEIQRPAVCGARLPQSAGPQGPLGAGAVSRRRGDRVDAAVVPVGRADPLPANVVLLLRLSQRGSALCTCRLQRVRRGFGPRGSRSPGISRAGGARCRRHLVVQPVETTRSGFSRARAIPTSPDSSGTTASWPATSGRSTSRATSECQPSRRYPDGWTRPKRMSSMASDHISIPPSR